MKSKFTTYLLIVAVIVIWGLITYRVFFSNDKQPAIQFKQDIASKDNREIDTLLLNYRNPFIAGRDKLNATKKVVVSKPQPTPAPQEPQIEPFYIHFIGTIERQENIFYIVELAGNQHTITIGSEIGGFRLVATDSHKLHFTKNKQDYYLAF